jgi:hypothetical protein
MMGRFKRGTARPLSGLLFTALLLTAAALFFSGCASDQPEDPNRVSTTPWNRPERWEGQGPLGGFNTDSR